MDQTRTITSGQQKNSGIDREPCQNDEHDTWYSANVQYTWAILLMFGELFLPLYQWYLIYPAVVAGAQLAAQVDELQFPHW